MLHFINYFILLLNVMYAFQDTIEFKIKWYVHGSHNLKIYLSVIISWTLLYQVFFFFLRKYIFPSSRFWSKFPFLTYTMCILPSWSTIYVKSCGLVPEFWVQEGVVTKKQGLPFAIYFREIWYYCNFRYNSPFSFGKTMLGSFRDKNLLWEV